MSAHQGVPNTNIYRDGECDTSAVTMDTVTTEVEKRWQYDQCARAQKQEMMKQMRNASGCLCAKIVLSRLCALVM